MKPSRSDSENSMLSVTDLIEAHPCFRLEEPDPGFLMYLVENQHGHYNHETWINVNGDADALGEFWEREPDHEHEGDEQSA